MAWPDKLKLNKQLIRASSEAGYTSPMAIQLKTLPRITGGQDLIAVGPEGCGKTTSYVLAVLNRLRYTTEGVPHTLILVPDKEHVLEVIARFETLNRNEQLLIVGLYATPGTEAQMNALADGADIVVATPDRARAIYLKLGLNLNKIELFIIDDAQQIVKQGLQLPVAELANSITKCQHLVFTEVVHDKLHKMIAPFMKVPALVEIEEIGETVLDTYEQVSYHVPNFATKLNLLDLFAQDKELFTKAIVFVNTAQTADKVFKSLQSRLKNEVVIFTPDFDFQDWANTRILIFAGENTDLPNLHAIPFLVHFELPAAKETFIQRVINDTSSQDRETLAITLTTDLELALLKKIEQAIGQKIPVGELPQELLIEKDKKTLASEGKPSPHKKVQEPVGGEAFHEKKASNAKNYNYSSGQKAKMNNKRKHS